MNFFLTTLLISSLIYATYAGECHVHSQPDHISVISNKDVQSSQPIAVSSFTNNLATLLGLSPDETENADQTIFYSTRPLAIPASTWLFHVEGVDGLSNDGIPLENNGEFNINSIHSKLSQTGHGDDLSVGSILINSKSDLDNLEESLKNQISQMNEQAPINYIVIVCNDCQNADSSKQLNTQLKAAIDKVVAKDPKTLAMTLVTKESAHVRRTRAVDDVIHNVTIAPMYSNDYPVMFNLFFWTSLTLAVIVIAIAYVFLTLDPGADTIIYRMTAPRLKVD